MTTVQQDFFYEALRVGPNCDHCGRSIVSQSPGRHDLDGSWVCERCVRNRRHFDQLVSGFYWVRRQDDDRWEPAEFKPCERDPYWSEWHLLGEEIDDDLIEVGPRIEAPSS